MKWIRGDIWWRKKSPSALKCVVLSDTFFILRWSSHISQFSAMNFAYEPHHDYIRCSWLERYCQFADAVQLIAERNEKLAVTLSNNGQKEVTWRHKRHFSSTHSTAIPFPFCCLDENEWNRGRKNHINFPNWKLVALSPGAHGGKLWNVKFANVTSFFNIQIRSTGTEKRKKTLKIYDAQLSWML